MENITLERTFTLLQEQFPKFIPYWERYTTYWETYAGIFPLMTPFSEYALEVIKANDPIELKKIFDCVEFLLCNGDESVRNGVATIFLEYLMSKDPDEIQFTKFAQYLGKNSKDYCKSWDEFNGTKTKGLYEE